MGDGNNPDLESFRKEWQEEVTARSKPKAPRHTGDKAQTHREKITASKPANALPPSEVYEQPDVDPVIGISAQAYHDLEDKEDARRLGIAGSRDVPTNQAAEEPKSALEHYEKAVEREDQGNLGDSVNLYRKAFRVSVYTAFSARVLNGIPTARCQCTQRLQEEAFSAIHYQGETPQPQSLRRSRHRTQHRPSLPTWSFS